MNYLTPDIENRLIGFNPHSPLLANELCTGPLVRQYLRCFNPHSPLLANELFCTIERLHDDAKFQSTFAIAGE